MVRDAHDADQYLCVVTRLPVGWAGTAMSALRTMLHMRHAFRRFRQRPAWSSKACWLSCIAWCLVL